VLEGHNSTKAEDTVVLVNGQVVGGSDGSPFKVHSDGIALSPDNRYLYYKALTGLTLYRIPTESLRDENLSEEDLGRHVETVALAGVCDGMVFDAAGRLYLSSLEEFAIKRLNLDGQIETIVQDPRISWPDSFARMPDGTICLTTSRIHEAGRFRDEFKIYRLTP
jgi:sugar lactone lactonase YvrE